MKLKTIIADPAGNITAYVLNPVDKSKHVDIAQRLMNLKEYKIEQVAFEKEPYDSEGYIEMMAGEFCGNATRSYGLYLMKTGSTKDSKKAFVRISGSDKVLTVETDETFTEASVEMPPILNISNIDTKTMGVLPIVKMEGISHVIVLVDNIDEINSESKSTPNTDESPNQPELLLEELKGIVDDEAFGIIYYEPSKHMMKPLIWVGGTGTAIWESSCGSGTVALAGYLNKDNGNDFDLAFNEPGGILQVKRENGILKLGGPVTISEMLEIEI
ncbi:MAG: hypothetical protein QMB63_02575 [Clostridiaceae bacterium]